MQGSLVDQQRAEVHRGQLRRERQLGGVDFDVAALLGGDVDAVDAHAARGVPGAPVFDKATGVGREDAEVDAALRAAGRRDPGAVFIRGRRWWRRFGLRGWRWSHGGARGDLTDGVVVRLAEPHVPFGPRDDLARPAGDFEFAHRATGGDAADCPVILGEPEVAVGSGRDVHGSPAVWGDREFGDRPAGRDPPDRVAEVLGEPDVAVGAGGDRVGYVRVVLGVGADFV